MATSHSSVRQILLLASGIIITMLLLALFQTPVSAAPLPGRARELQSEMMSSSSVKTNPDLQRREGRHVPGTGTGIGSDFNKNNPFGRKK
ncbi:hypothetical protein BGZ70_006182 [Mortierella alpina]|uniref:Uncharacterized protein n=1 Tax=Mortierella alpina TaxID=64518 RepID=A0A9P6JBJ8_MORAP|nr:hypothetical protein BGZ70_006182 [Mortierella alpina]